jgi:uncharacterized protein
MYQNGQGVAQDAGRAVQLYQKGCDGGDTDACQNLKRLRGNGQN